MQSVRPDISVIVPHYQDLAGLETCLRSLERQVVPDRLFEIIVADNNSPVGEDAIRLAIAGRAKLVLVTEKGAGPARNGGAEAALGAILAFTDSDCVPETGWLAAGVTALEHAGLVGGQMEVLVADAANPTGAEAFEMVFAFANARYVRRENFTVTANLFVRRDDFERVGGFRAGVSEDVEWCRRAASAGLRLVYAQSAIVGHPARRSWADLRRKWDRIAEEQYRLAVDLGSGRLSWLVRTWALPLSAVAHVPRVVFSKVLPHPRARFLALGILFRLRWWRFVKNQRLLWEDATGPASGGHAAGQL